MFAPSLPIIFIISAIVVNVLRAEDYRHSTCSSAFQCGRIKDVIYPFWGGERPNYCGHPDFELDCSDDGDPKIEINSRYLVLDINQTNQTLRIARSDAWDGLCSLRMVNTTLNFGIVRFSQTDVNLTLFYLCPRTRNSSDFLTCKLDENIGGFHIAFSSELEQMKMHRGCRVSIEIPVIKETVEQSQFDPAAAENVTAIEEILKGGFDVDYEGNATYCLECKNSGGQCGYNWTTLETVCFCEYGLEEKICTAIGTSVRLKVAIGVSAGIGCIILTCITFLVCQRRKKNKFSKSSNLITRDISDRSLKPDVENGSIYFQTPIFTYKELDEATNHFDTNKEVGDGGFGTVYHGKLRDGRVVAVKRLFEHNYKRVEQFMNEIEILSRIRHQNLVSLYGCTSQHSRELLLVYEYVPNGTVADHVHGERSKSGLLTWPIRMSIAIESADALAYLHASDIIHRDVKSNNILLDNNFHVKVADFGLSRLFPTDVTHVSTAPQGTPGYVDPEYYQCYQLNDKSDVYSFGVVLIELISSKPAVDIGRHRHEVNLASLAINKIQSRTLHELVDPSLGFDTDYSARNMITSVAELAFRCLQQEKEMRPCMVEVVEVLRGIQSEDVRKKSDEIDASADASLLKNLEPLSPVSVTDKWASKSTTPNTSAGGML